GAGARPRAAGPARAVRQSAGTAGAAVEASLPLLQKSDVTFMRKSGCVSCHNNSITAMTVAAARRHGLKVDERVAAEQARKIATYLESWPESLLRGAAI